jgi:hypothetical protein
VGAIIGSNVYLARQAPKYPTGFGVCFSFLVLGIVMACLLRFAYARANRMKIQIIEKLGGEQGVLARYSEQELLDMGDKSPFFKYTL